AEHRGQGRGGRTLRGQCPQHVIAVTAPLLGRSAQRVLLEARELRHVKGDQPFGLFRERGQVRQWRGIVDGGHDSILVDNTSDDHRPPATARWATPVRSIAAPRRWPWSCPRTSPPAAPRPGGAAPPPPGAPALTATCGGML